MTGVNDVVSARSVLLNGERVEINEKGKKWNGNMFDRNRNRRGITLFPTKLQRFSLTSGFFFA